MFITQGVDEAVLPGSRVIVMSPRPGRIVPDEPVAFSSSSRRSTDIRSDPAARAVREVIAKELP